MTLAAFWVVVTAGLAVVSAPQRGHLIWVYPVRWEYASRRLQLPHRMGDKGLIMASTMSMSRYPL